MLPPGGDWLGSADRNWRLIKQIGSQASDALLTAIENPKDEAVFQPDEVGKGVFQTLFTDPLVGSLAIQERFMDKKYRGGSQRLHEAIKFDDAEGPVAEVYRGAGTALGFAAVGWQKALAAAVLGGVGRADQERGPEGQIPSNFNLFINSLISGTEVLPFFQLSASFGRLARTAVKAGGGKGKGKGVVPSTGPAPIKPDFDAARAALDRVSRGTLGAGHIVKRGAAVGAYESFQEGGAEYARNVAAGADFDPTRDPTENVGKGAALGLAIGFGLGATGGGVDVALAPKAGDLYGNVVIGQKSALDSTPVRIKDLSDRELAKYSEDLEHLHREIQAVKSSPNLPEDIIRRMNEEGANYRTISEIVRLETARREKAKNPYATPDTPSGDQVHQGQFVPGEESIPDDVVNVDPGAKPGPRPTTDAPKTPKPPPSETFTADEKTPPIDPKPAPAEDEVRYQKQRVAAYSRLREMLDTQPEATTKSGAKWRQYFNRKQMSTGEMDATGINDLLDAHGEEQVTREQLLSTIDSGLDLRGQAVDLAGEGTGPGFDTEWLLNEPNAPSEPEAENSFIVQRLNAEHANYGNDSSSQSEITDVILRSRSDHNSEYHGPTANIYSLKQDGEEHWAFDISDSDYVSNLYPSQEEAQHAATFHLEDMDRGDHTDPSADNDWRGITLESRTIGTTATTPENYREIPIVIDGISDMVPSAYQGAISTPLETHWQGRVDARGHQREDVVMHIRTTDHMIDGKKYLMVQELQSDLFQGARDAHERVLTNAKEAKDGEKDGIDYGETSSDSQVVQEELQYEKFQKNTPYSSTASWVTLGMRHALEIAATEGYEGVIWLGGNLETQLELNRRSVISSSMRSALNGLDGDGKYEQGLLDLISQAIEEDPATPPVPYLDEEGRKIGHAIRFPKAFELMKAMERSGDQNKVDAARTYSTTAGTATVDSTGRPEGLIRLKGELEARLAPGALASQSSFGAHHDVKNGDVFLESSEGNQDQLLTPDEDYVVSENGQQVIISPHILPNPEDRIKLVEKGGFNRFQDEVVTKAVKKHAKRNKLSGVIRKQKINPKLSDVADGGELIAANNLNEIFVMPLTPEDRDIINRRGQTMFSKAPKLPPKPAPKTPRKTKKQLAEDEALADRVENTNYLRNRYAKELEKIFGEGHGIRIDLVADAIIRAHTRSGYGVLGATLVRSGSVTSNMQLGVEADLHTMRHEGLHIALSRGAFSAEQVEALYEQMRREGWDQTFDIASSYPDVSNNLFAEEAIAAWMTDYSKWYEMDQNRRISARNRAHKSKLHELVYNFWKWLERLYYSLHRTRAEKIARDFFEGKLSKKKPVKHGESEGTKRLKELVTRDADWWKQRRGKDAVSKAEAEVRKALAPSNVREPAYSRARELIAAQPEATTKSGAKWRQYFNRKQMSTGEMDATGINDLLDAHGEEQVTREQLLSTIDSGLDLRGEAVDLAVNKTSETEWEMSWRTRDRDYSLDVPAQDEDQMAVVEKYIVEDSYQQENVVLQNMREVATSRHGGMDADLESAVIYELEYEGDETKWYVFTTPDNGHISTTYSNLEEAKHAAEWYMEEQHGPDGSDSQDWRGITLESRGIAPNEKPKNYREIPIVIDGISDMIPDAYWYEIKRSLVTHWGDRLEENQARQQGYSRQDVVMHIRTTDHMLDGKKYLMIQEFQSDLFQGARDAHERLLTKANTDAEGTGRFLPGSRKETREENEQYEKFQKNTPYSSTASWVTLGMRHALEIAATEGYEGVIWLGGNLETILEKNQRSIKTSALRPATHGQSPDEYHEAILKLYRAQVEVQEGTGDTNHKATRLARELRTKGTDSEIEAVKDFRSKTNYTLDELANLIKITETRLMPGALETDTHFGSKSMEGADIALESAEGSRALVKDEDYVMDQWGHLIIHPHVQVQPGDRIKATEKGGFNKFQDEVVTKAVKKHAKRNKLSGVIRKELLDPDFDSLATRKDIEASGGLRVADTDAMEHDNQSEEIFVMPLTAEDRDIINRRGQTMFQIVPKPADKGAMTAEELKERVDLLIINRALVINAYTHFGLGLYEHGNSFRWDYDKRRRAVRIGRDRIFQEVMADTLDSGVLNVMELQEVAKLEALAAHIYNTVMSPAEKASMRAVISGDNNWDFVVPFMRWLTTSSDEMYRNDAMFLNAIEEVLQSNKELREGLLALRRGIDAIYRRTNDTKRLGRQTRTGVMREEWAIDLRNKLPSAFEQKYSNDKVLGGNKYHSAVMRWRFASVDGDSALLLIEHILSEMEGPYTNAMHPAWLAAAKLNTPRTKDAGLVVHYGIPTINVRPNGGLAMDYDQEQRGYGPQGMNHKRSLFNILQGLVDIGGMDYAYEYLEVKIMQRALEYHELAKATPKGEKPAVTEKLLSENEIKDRLRELTKKQLADFADTDIHLDRMIGDLRQLMVDSGLKSKAWVKSVEGKTWVPYGRSGYGQVRSMEEFTGAAKTLKDPVENLMDAILGIVDAAVVNMFKIEVAKLADKDGGGRFLARAVPDSEQKGTGVAEMRKTLESKLGDDKGQFLVAFDALNEAGLADMLRSYATRVIDTGSGRGFEYMQNGEVVRMDIAHPLLLALMDFKQPPRKPGKVLSAWDMLRRFRQGTVTYNILFPLLYSMPKDWFNAAFRAQEGQLFINPFKGIKLREPRTWVLPIAAMDNQWAGRYYLAGGMFGLASAEHQAGRRPDFKNPKGRGWGRVGRGYMEVIRRMEAAPRIMRFAELIIKHGKTPEEARMMADTASGNYHLQGMSEVSRTAGKLLEWLHPTVSSFVTIADILKDGARSRRFLAGVLLVAGLMVMSRMWNALMGIDDDETALDASLGITFFFPNMAGFAFYEKYGRWAGQGDLTPAAKHAESFGMYNHITVPVGYEVGGLGQIMGNIVLSNMGMLEDGQLADRLMENIKRIIYMPAAGMASFPLDLYANRNMRGVNVVPMSEQGLPQKEQATTNEFASMLAEQTGLGPRFAELAIREGFTMTGSMALAVMGQASLAMVDRFDEEALLRSLLRNNPKASAKVRKGWKRMIRGREIQKTIEHFKKDSQLETETYIAEQALGGNLMFVPDLLTKELKQLHTRVLEVGRLSDNDLKHFAPSVGTRRDREMWLARHHTLEIWRIGDTVAASGGGVFVPSYDKQEEIKVAYEDGDYGRLRTLAIDGKKRAQNVIVIAYDYEITKAMKDLRPVFEEMKKRTDAQRAREKQK